MMHLKYLSYVIKKVIREQGDRGWEKREEEGAGWEKKEEVYEKVISGWKKQESDWRRERKGGWKEKRVGEGRKWVGEMRKRCEKGEATPLSNPAKVMFKFMHRTMASLSLGEK